MGFSMENPAYWSFPCVILLLGFEITIFKRLLRDENGIVEYFLRFAEYDYSRSGKTLHHKSCLRL